MHAVGSVDRERPGALSNLGHTVARSTIANILREHGIEPAPERSERTPWRTFLAAHWGTVAATDFFTVEVATVRRLVTYYVLVVIGHLNSLFVLSNSLIGHLEFPVLSEQGIAI